MFYIGIFVSFLFSLSLFFFFHFLTFSDIVRRDFRNTKIMLSPLRLSYDKGFAKSDCIGVLRSCEPQKFYYFSSFSIAFVLLATFGCTRKGIARYI